MTLAAGTQFGSFEIIGQIGSGGMGEVWRAKDTVLKRDVALKLLPDALIDDADRLARFQREAEILASLNHPNIAQVFGLEQADGQTAIVMELVEGPTLADRIAEGAIPLDDAMDIALQILAAIEAAHDKGIVHRDLKPANVKQRGDGSVKVLDFGISKPIDASAISGGSPVATTPAVTATGVILGTAAYMSPEQAKGKFVDERTDIWAFGCLLFEMLTGQPAFAGEDVMAILARVLERDTDLESIPGTITPAVRHTIRLCLEKDPRKRIADIRDVRLALEGRFDAGLNDRSAADSRTPSFSRQALLMSAALAAGALLAGIVIRTAVEPMSGAPAIVSRLPYTPPPSAPLANTDLNDLAISPDGRRFAYVVANPVWNVLNIHVRDLGALDARPIPGVDDQLSATNPFFSPDGRRIAFVSPQGIMRASLDGEAMIKIVDNPPEGVLQGGSWTADGTVFYSGRSLHSVSDGGGGTSVTLGAFSTGTNLILPEPLHGGRAVLFTLIQGPNTSIVLLDLETGEQRSLIENGSQATYTPTGHIVFMRGGTLMAARFDLDRLDAGDPVALLPGIRHSNASATADYALSDTGTLVYVPGGDEGASRSELVWFDRGGNVSGRAVGEFIDNVQHLRLSPDGQRVAVTTGPRRDNDLWVYDFTGQPTFPVSTVYDEQFAAWSPDATRLAFLLVRDGTSTLVATSADGGLLDPAPLLTDGFNAVPDDWSETGEMILELSSGEIVAVSANGSGDVRTIVAPDGGYAVHDAALSPNGRWLAYTSTRSGAEEVWVQGYPDGGPRQISANGGYEPVWSHDGDELFYLRGDTLMSVAVGTDGAFPFEPASELFTSPDFVSSADALTKSYDVAPDGRFLMVRMTSSSSEPGRIVVVQNWFEELERLMPPN